MSRFDLVFIFAAVLVCAPVSAQEPKREVAAEAPAKRYPLASQMEVGVSYVQWNERMALSQGAVLASGYASYAGPGLTLEYNRRRARLQWGASTTIAAGKAAAGGFSGVAFADGVDRLWYGWFLHAFGHYRVNPTFMIGLGALGRARIIDWEPNDKTIRVDTSNPVAAAPTMNVRWTILDTVTLAQSFALLGLDGETQWTWSAQYVF